MKQYFTSKAQLIISVAGLVAVFATFIIWLAEDKTVNTAGTLLAAVSVILFSVVCLKFVKNWTELWKGQSEPKVMPEEGQAEGTTLFVIFLLFLLYDFAILFIIHEIRVLVFSDTTSYIEGLELFLHIDTGYYLKIAEQWYVNSAEYLPDLVFYPAYPILIRLLNALVHNTLLSAVIISAVFYALSACVLYLLFFDCYGKTSALRAVKYLAIVPASFFFAAPMSESLFLFLSISAYYEARKGKWLFACIIGALCAFTRSLGVIIFAPMGFLALTGIVREPENRKRWLGRLLMTLIIPLGTAAYFIINWDVTGNPFAFSAIEQDVWKQGLGLFFDSTAFQIDNGLADLQQPYFTNALGLWFPNVLYCMAVLLLMAVTAQKLNAEISLWFICYYAVAIGATYLVSAPRYLVACLPVHMAIVAATENKKTDIILTVGSLLFGAYYLFAFSARWEVY